jgi:peptide/nickel transport system permease protein
VAGKLVFYLIVIFFAVTLVFFITVYMPGDPVEVMLARGNYPVGVDIKALENAMRAYFGLDRPLLDRYITYLGGIFTGNLGMSFTNYPVSVATIVLYYLPYTLALAIPVLVVSFFLGNWIGARAAYLKGKWNETGYFTLVLCNQLPTFWFAMVLVFFYVVLFQGIPPIGARTQGVIPDLSLGYIGDLLAHWALPFLTLIVVYLGAWATGMRSMVTHEMDSGYVRYGEQLGFRKSKLMSYTERNAILPQFTGLNLVFSGIIGNTLIIEIVFGWPGIGLLLFNSVGALDYPLVFGCFLVIVLVIVVGNFLIDILYGFIDPRIRTGHG